MNDLLIDLKKNSEELKVASLRDATLSLLLDTINKNHVKSVLEIGTGVGYSAYAIYNNDNDITIDTIELSNDRYSIAKQYLSHIKNINLIHGDCFLFNSDKTYDLILIDGPKRNQIKLFEHLLKFTHKNTIFFIDNLQLQKIRSIKNKKNNQQTMINDVDAFKKYLLAHKEYQFQYLEFDDGVMIGKK